MLILLFSVLPFKVYIVVQLDQSSSMNEAFEAAFSYCAKQSAQAPKSDLERPVNLLLVEIYEKRLTSADQSEC